MRSIVDDDIRRVDGVRRSQRKFEMLLHSLARNESTLASNNTLMRDMMEETNETIDSNTVADYLDVLRRLFIIEEQPAFSPNLGSSIRIGKSSKRQFVDPSLAAAAADLIRINKFMVADKKAVAPEILCVICGITGYSYIREDGVMVVPITELKP